MDVTRRLSLLLAACSFIAVHVHVLVNADSVSVNAAKLNQNFFSIFTDGVKDLNAKPVFRGGSRSTPDPNKIDLLFVMDNSGSIGSANFVKQKTFVSLMIDHVLTVTCTKSIRVAIISFAASSQITVEFDFNDYSGSATPRVDLKNAVNGIVYVHGWATNTAGALDEAHSLYNDASRGARSDATRVVFVLTDGKSNQGGAPGPKADVLQNTDGARVFAAGVANFGSTSSDNELNAIASQPDANHRLVVDDFDDMDDIAAEFGAKLRCNVIDLATYRPEDWNSIVAGFKTIKQNGVINDLAALHNQVFSVSSSAHGGAGFFPWHRSFLSMLEHALQIAQNDVSLRLPYWDWSGEHVATSAIWAHLGSGSLNNGAGPNDCVNSGHFSQALWHPDPSECIVRNVFNPVPGTQQASQAQLNNDRTSNPIYDNFRPQTEGSGARHNTLHGRFGSSDMNSGESPRDPLFYLHHCFIDKLWYDWQELYGDDESNYPADGTPGVVYTLNSVMNFLTAAYPGGTDLLKESAWRRPKNVLKVGNLGYTYAQSSGTPFGRKKRQSTRLAVSSIKRLIPHDTKIEELFTTERPYTPEPDLSVSTIRAMIASRRPTRQQVVQWDFDTQCWFESDLLTPSQRAQCIHRGIIPGIRLVNGPNQYEGRVEILVDGHYHAVCSDGWDNVEANIVCAQLGYSTGQATPGSRWGYSKKPYVISKVGCTGNEKYIQDCPRYNLGTTYQGGYCPSYQYAGVKCNPGVRFTRNGLSTTSPNGYLQVYDSSTKQWGPVCGGSAWGNRQRTDACQQAGFGPAYSVLHTVFARKTASGPQTSARCLSSTNKQIDCNQGVQWGASTCAKSTDNLYISCQKPIRLVGLNRYEGRVEVFNGGVWGTVCDRNWDAKDAQVVCKQLGYHYGGTAYQSARYGRGRGPVWLDNVNCYGSENAITDCKHSGFGQTSCSHNRDASVRCNLPPVIKVPGPAIKVPRPVIKVPRRLEPVPVPE